MKKILAVLAVAATMASAPAAAVSAFASFTGSNGNAGFFYGFTNSSTLTAFNTSANSGCALNGATCLYDNVLGVLPFASVGGSFSTVDVPSNAIVVHPGNAASQSAYVSYAAAGGGYSYSIDIQSRGKDSTNGIGYTPFTSVGGVVTLGTRGVITGYTADYSNAVNLSGIVGLAPGQQFGVIIDYNGNYGGDSTGINFSISSVPEPASWAMILAGFGMVGFAARRRKVALAA